MPSAVGGADTGGVEAGGAEAGGAAAGGGAAGGGAPLHASGRQGFEGLGFRVWGRGIGV